MLEPIEGRIDILVAEFTEAVTSSHNSDNAGLYWKSFFTNFLKKMINLYSVTEQTCDPSKFTFCLAGPVVRSIGSPLSTIDAFVVLKDENNEELAKKLTERISTAMKKVEEELLAISKKTNTNYLRLSTVKITPTVFCGTAEQLITKMRSMSTDSCINAIFTAIPLVGDPQILTNFHNKLFASPICSTHIYDNPVSFFYGVAVVEFDGAINRKAINLKNDIMRPVLAILDGLRLEFNLDVGISPEVIVKNLLNDKKISEDAVRLFTLVLNRIGQLRWYLDMQHRQTQELIPTEFENINEIIQIVALLRGEASKRIKTEGNKISLHENRPATFAIDKANAPYLDRIFSQDNKAFDLYVATDIIPIHIKGELSQINKNISKANTAAGIATRYFNNIDNPKHLATYSESFFQCVQNSVLNKNKFNKWMNMVISRCVHDLFDEEGNLKKSIIDIVNINGMYDRIIAEVGKEDANKDILFSYFMNPLLGNTILLDQRYQDLKGDMESENNISRATQQFTNEYFNRNIKIASVTIKEIHNANYCNSLLKISTILETLVKQFRIALRYNLDEREVNLYLNCLGKESDHDSLLGICRSLNEYLDRNMRNPISTEVFHDFRDKIYHCLNNFIIASAPLREEQSKRTYWTKLFATDPLLKHIRSDVSLTQIEIDAVCAELIILQPVINHVAGQFKRQIK